MDAYKIEAIAKIKCDIGIENITIRHIAFKGWAIMHNDDIIYMANTEKECMLLLKEVKHETLA